MSVWQWGLGMWDVGLVAARLAEPARVMVLFIHGIRVAVIVANLE